MSRRGKVSRIIDLYGDDIEVISKDETRVICKGKAIIQPLRDVNCSGAECYDNSKYRYIGSVDIRIDTYPLGTIIRVDKDKYKIKNSNLVFYGAEKIYVSAILKKQ